MVPVAISSQVSCAVRTPPSHTHTHTHLRPTPTLPAQATEELTRLRKQVEVMSVVEASLRNQLDASQRQCECPVCLEPRPDLLLCCGHLVCDACARKLKACPCCRKPHHHSAGRKVYWG